MRLIRSVRSCAALLLVALALAMPVQAQTGGPDEQRLDAIGFDQRLNEQAPLDLVFRDETGQAVRLGDYFGTKPVILTLNYYECPNLCTLILTQLVHTMRGLAFNAGEQFEVVTVSIDPREQPALAAAKKATYLERYGRQDAAVGWHFLTGEQAQIEQLADAVGFRYAYDARQDQYAHPSGIIVLTPQGRISRYFYNLDYTPRDLRLGLVEASAGQVGTPVDQFLLRCYHYDPTSGQYTPAIMNIVRMIGLATILVVGASLFLLFRRDPRRRLGI